MSGNTQGGVMWSDAKQEFPMMPQVSYVQRCPGCGHYYITSRVKEQKEGDNYSFETGDLSWEEMKEAISELKEWDINDDEKIYLMMCAIWVYNDKFQRKENSPKPDAQDEEIRRYIIDNILFLITDKLLLAEFYREIGNFDDAIYILERIRPANQIHIDAASKILAHAKEKDTKPFIIN